MKLYAHLIQPSNLRLWGLTPGQRLQRQLAQLEDIDWAHDLKMVPPDAEVLLLRGDQLYDQRVLVGLAERSNLLVFDHTGTRPVAARVASASAPGLRALLAGQPGARLPRGLRSVTPADLGSGFDTKLRKLSPPQVRPIDAVGRAALERELFDDAYKGITDLITKWLWPLPARWATRACVRLGIRPNQVTALSWLLALAVGLLFSVGELGWGLAAGWLMTFLDTVDGKLARVTLTSTRFGNLFDHLLDQIHPPFWYLAWGLGLASYAPGIPGLGLGLSIGLIFAGYIGGRLAEASFRRWLQAPFSIFAWRRFDSYTRLITARRNPSLVFLTAGALGGRPDLGLAAVLVWTLASSALLLGRLTLAWRQQLNGQELRSWLGEVGNRPAHDAVALRWFAGRRTGPEPG